MIEVFVVTNVLSRKSGWHSFSRDIQTAEVSALLPAEYESMRDIIVPMIGTRKVSWTDSAVSGERVSFLVAPRGAEFIFYIFVMFAASVIMQALMPKPPKPTEDNSSPVYGYQGITPSRVEGDPIPLYYGEVRVGGQIINEFVDDFGALGAQYNVLVSLGEGPLDQIAGTSSSTVAPLLSEGYPPIPTGRVFVNDTDASALQGVEVHVRLGSLEQQPIEGYETASATVTIDTELSTPTTGTATTSEQILNYASPIALSAGGSSNATWNSSGISYAMLTPADSATIKVLLPEGLGQVDQSNGSIYPGFTGIAVRYIELDNAGNPITSSGLGTDGDGYVRLRPFRFYARFNSGVSYDIRVPFYDPQTFIRPPLQNYADFNSGGMMASTGPGDGVFQRVGLRRTTGITVPDAGSQWNSGGSADSFTVSMFFYPRNLTSYTASGTGGSTVRIGVGTATTGTWLNLSGAGTEGFSIGAVSRQFSPQAGQSFERIIPSVRFGGVIFHEDNTELGDATYTIPSPGYNSSNIWNLVNRSFTGWPAAGDLLDNGSFTAANVFYGWQHLVAVYERAASGTQNRIRLYVNGYKLFDYLTSTSVTLPAFGSASLTLNGPSLYGRLSNVAIYKGVMGEDDILTQYNNGQGRTLMLTSLNPVVFYKFASSGALLTDSSGNGNTLSQYDIVGTLADVTSRNEIAIIPGDQSGTSVPKAGRYKVEVMRAFYNSTSSYIQDTQRWVSLRLNDDQPYSYPSSPLLAVRVRATSEINGSLPRVTSIVRGRLVPVWDRASIDQPTFVMRYSNNPAWVLCDILLNKQWGLGTTFEPSDLDMVSIGDWADYCAEFVYDQSGFTAPYNAATTGGGMTWYDIDYDFDYTFQTNALYFEMPLNGATAAAKVGQFMSISGVPVVPGYADINSATTGEVYRVIKVKSISTFYDIVVVAYTGAAPWPLTQSLSTQGVTLAGTLQGRHSRFEFDGAIDQQQPAWDAILNICSSARAVPIRDGKRLRVAVYRPRPVVDIIGQGQVVQGSFEVEYLSPRTRFNQIEIGFLDRDLNYERSMASDEHASVQGTTDSGLLRRRTFFLEGVVRRAQVLRQAKFLLNQEHLVRRKGRFIGSVDLLALEPLDVIRISNDLINRGVSGRITASTGAIVIDKEITLAPATTYKISIRSAQAEAGVLPEERTITTGAGTIAIGGIISVSSPFTISPTKGDVYTIWADGADLLAQIDSISLTPDLQREIQWSEYDESIYDFEDPGDIPDIGIGFLTASDNAGSNSSAPARVTEVRLREVVVRGPGGAHQPRLSVAWTCEDGSDDVAGFDIFISNESLDGRYFEHKATAGQAERSAILVMEEATPGTAWLVAVTARSRTGAAMSPQRSAKAAIRISGRSPAPSTPVWHSQAASLDGELATYRIDRNDGDESSTVEVRRGGWVVGQRVGALPQYAGKIGPTSNWTSTVSTSLSNLSHLHGVGSSARLFARSISERTRFSAAALTSWSPSVVDSEVPVQTVNRTFFSISWEDFGIGWRRSGPVVPNATLTGCQVTTSALFPQGYLEFSGTNLAATYTTASPFVEVDQRAEWFYNSAFAEAEQVWPQTWADNGLTYDEGEAQLTWEGPLAPVSAADDPGRVTLKIECRTYDSEGGYSAWAEFSPGKVRCIFAEWRIVMTRPSTAYQIRVHRFSTQLLRIPRQRFERSGLQYFAEHQIFGRT